MPITVDPGLALIVVALIQAVSIYFQHKNLKATEKVQGEVTAVQGEVTAVQGEVKVVRTQTNHMHDVIVAAKEKVAFAAGQSDAREENAKNEGMS